MQNPNKSSANKKKLALIVFLALLSLVLTLSFVGSCIFFFDIWQEKAFNIDMRARTEVQFQNGNEVVVYNCTFAVENYYPLRNFTAYPIILIRNSTHVIEQYNCTSQDLTKLKIKIDSYELRTSYGDKEFGAPYKVVSPPSFPNITARGMLKTTLIINWRYNKTETEAGQEKNRTALLYGTSPRAGVLRIVPQEEILSREIWSTLEGTFPYLFFVFSGFMFSFYVFQKGKLMNDYSVLSRFPKAYQKAGASEKKEMEKSLGRIAGFPKEVGRIWRLLFGMSIFVVKALVNDMCKIHGESIESNKKIATFRRNSLSGIFLKGTKSTFEKIEDTLPELKTIGIVVAALTAVGVSFSFNVGAAAPFLYSLALFYFFFNLGSIFQFVIKSYRDRYWALAAIFVAIFVILLPKIVDIFRLAT